MDSKTLLQRRSTSEAISRTREAERTNYNYKNHLLVNIIIALFFAATFNAASQRHMEYLTRGLAAVKSTDYVFVSWRIFATDGDSVQFNLYRDGTLLNAAPISGLSNYMDSSGTKSNIYYLETVYNSGRTEFSTPVTVWDKQYKSIPVQLPASNYFPNDASIADLDGDGEMEIIIKIQMSEGDVNPDGYRDPVYIHAYKMNGTLLWSIDLGVNIRAGSHYTQFMVYDLDGDGLAEVSCKTAPGTKDGSGNYLSKGPAASDNDAIDYRNSGGAILSGPEYLTVFNGLTGEEITTVYYVPRRHPDTENPTSYQLEQVWGDGYGNRSERYLACVAYFDTLPSLVMCRGYYTRTVLAAWDFNGDTITQRWVFDTDNGYPAYAGQGNHNLSVADVDQDGKDEIVYGAMCVDHDGTGLWTTGLGHGDAMHVSDIDPDRPGLEKWGITESSGTSGSQLLDARTGEIIWGTPAGDIARGVSADIDSTHFGMECWGGTDRLRSCKDSLAGPWPSSSNFVIWWDGDLLRELLDGITISKYNYGSDIPLFTAKGCMTNNSTKSTPTISGDIFGDWREEVIFKTMDNQELRIYTTTTPTQYGVYTLLQDPQYRLALAWQNVAYNQPPHPGFFLGYGVDIDTLPIPDIKVHKANHPSISITAPDEDFELGLGLDLNIIVHAVGISDTNHRVIISQDGTPIDTIMSAPYYTSIPGLTTGNYFFIASAFNIDGNIMKSDTLHISVDEGYPHVAIISPEEGNTYLPADSITITADAYDTDGSIDSVAIYINDSRLITFTSLPYSIKIENPGVGSYDLKAIAYDNDGKFTESDVVLLEVGVVNTIQENETGFCGFKNGTGWIESNNVGYTGTGFANSDNVLGVDIIWAIDFPASGDYKFEWRYACTEARPGILLLNDTTISDVPFINTVAFTTWESISLNSNVQKGIKRVALRANHSKGLPNIDYIKIYSLDTDEEITGLICDTIYSSDATLSNLSVTGATISPVFDRDTLNYHVDLAYGTTTMNIVATPTNPFASVVGAGAVAVTQPSDTIDIVVTAENGTSTLTYTIIYNVLNSIQELSVGGLIIYPIPVQDYIMIESDDNSEIINDINIYTFDGRKIISKNRINSSQINIEFPETQNGIYLIQINTNKQSYSGKIIISK
ncbi:MAG: T9SS type A sorting domain-containing protein [Bacteroidales bacterium]|nr:T9SS type A sorting domain-containing protein [Bacteroidales bacterium]